MARIKAEMKCPYCGEVKAVSGMTSHVRHKHPEHYETDFKPNRLALVEKFKIVEGKPAPVVVEKTTPVEEEAVETPEPAKVGTPEPVEKREEPVEKQQSGSFLGIVGKALRDW